jgi:iron complex transport system substrate-binding protein
MRRLGCRASFVAAIAAALPAASLLASGPAAAAVSATDDTGRTITLAAPARRIVSLAPHTTELLFASGAGSWLVGVTDYSDYPPQANRIPSVGSAAAFDVERIVSLRPDLVVAWGSGNSASKIAALRQLGIPVFDSEPREFETIASSMERLARLAGTEPAGQAAARAFRVRLQTIAANYRQRPPVRVFYQIWRAPLMTLNDDHLVSDAIQLCGGQNIFGKLRQLAPSVSMEAVLKENPEVIITGSGGEPDPLAQWRRFPAITAVARDNLFTVASETMTRSGPRILDGTETLCRQLALARSRRK